MFTGRKSVRENKLFGSGGLLSFPRTGCALFTLRRSYHNGRRLGTMIAPPQSGIAQSTNRRLATGQCRFTPNTLS